MNNDKWTDLIIYTICAFLYPAIFRWIWNWQFGDIYMFTYWQAWWLSVAVSSLLDINNSVKYAIKSIR